MLIYVGSLLEVKPAEQWQEFGGKLVQFVDATLSHAFNINGKLHRDHFLINLLPKALDGAELGDEIHLSLWLDVNGPIDPRDCVGRRGPMHVIQVFNASKAKRDAAEKFRAGLQRAERTIDAFRDGLRRAGLGPLLDAPGATEKRPSGATRRKAAGSRKRDSEAPAKRGRKS